MIKKLVIPILCFLVLNACVIRTPNELPTPTTASTLKETPTEIPVMADSFFFGHAFIDANGNGQLDESDPALKGAIFPTVDANGVSSGGITDSTGTAMAWWPASSMYPVTLKMKPPENSDYTLIGESEIVLQAYETSANFLFAPPD